MSTDVTAPEHEMLNDLQEGRASMPREGADVDAIPLTPKERVAALAFADRIYASVVNDESMSRTFLAAYIGDTGPKLSQIDQAKLLQLAQQCRDLRAALVRACEIAAQKLDDERGEVINRGGYLDPKYQPKRSAIAELLSIAEPMS
jgi:hypothetical protein